MRQWEGQGSALLGRGVERVSSNGECPSEALLLMGASTRKLSLE